MIHLMLVPRQSITIIEIGKSDLIDTNCIDQSAEINETLISFIELS